MMSKLDELMKTSRGIASESMGRPPVATAMHRASAPAAAPMPDRLQGIARSRNAAEIPLDKIDRDPGQPREEFEPEAPGPARRIDPGAGPAPAHPGALDEGRSLYVIVCGERRWRAAGMAGSTTMSCVIMDGPISSAELLSLQLVENLVREDLKPIEQAKAFRAVMDLNGWSTHDVARELAVDQSSVVRALNSSTSRRPSRTRSSRAPSRRRPPTRSPSSRIPTIRPHSRPGGERGPQPCRDRPRPMRRASDGPPGGRAGGHAGRRPASFAGWRDAPSRSRTAGDSTRR